MNDYLHKAIIIATLAILFFCSACSRLPEALLKTPIQKGTEPKAHSQWYGELQKPEMQPPDQYKFDAVEATVIFEDNDIHHNNRAGISIRGSQPVRISRCRLYNNGTGGIRAFSQTHIYLDSSSIHSNRTGGIDMREGRLLSIRKTSIFLNGEGGIRIQGGYDSQSMTHRTEVDIRSSRIFLNRQGGISIKSAPSCFTTVTLADSAIFKNDKAGVRIEDNTWLTAWDNVFTRNLTAGVAAASPSGTLPVLDLFQNRISFNHGAGIFITAGKTGRYGISNNWIYNNYRVGIGCGLEKSPFKNRTHVAILHNTIVANGAGNIGAGIRDDTGGTVLVQNNIIAWNVRTGMMVGNCRDASYNLLYANGEVSDFDKDDTSAYLFERLQYAGCPSTGTGDLIENPLFSAPDQYDFRLKEESPAQDAGNEIDTPYFLQFDRTDMGSLYVPPGLYQTGFYRRGISNDSVQ